MLIHLYIVAIHMFQCTKIGHLDVLNKLHIQDDTRHFAQIFCCPHLHIRLRADRLFRNKE